MEYLLLANIAKGSMLLVVNHEHVYVCFERSSDNINCMAKLVLRLKCVLLYIIDYTLYIRTMPLTFTQTVPHRTLL